MARGSRPGRAALIVLVLLSLLLITLDRSGVKAPANAVRDGVQVVTGPVVRGAGTVFAPVGAFLERLGGGPDEDELRRLRDENAVLRGEIRRSDFDRRRAAELDELLRNPVPGSEQRVPARVVGVGGALGFERTVLLDTGTLDGVQAGMTVLNGDGLVGRVVAASPFTCTVLLVTDGTSGVGVRMERTGAIGQLVGQGSAPPRLELFDPRAPVAPGDRMVTLGSTGSPFVPEVAVAEVTEVQSGDSSLLRTAATRPFVDFGSVDLVAVVVQPPRDQPRAGLPAAGAS